MATRTKKQTATVEPVEQPIEVTDPEPEGVQAMRASLRAAGLKRCPTHAHYLDRLPEVFRTPVQGQTDPAVRPLDEFTGHISACKQCAKLRSADKRSEHRTASGKPANSVARLVALMRREDEILAKAKALRATMSEDDLDQAEALYHAATTAE